MAANRLFIGTLAKQAGVNPRTIRYYEAIGLLPQAQRGENRYRVYPKEAVELLQFIAKAQSLGFTLSEIREIVGIRRMGSEPCAHVRALMELKIADLDRMLTDLVTLRKRLKRLLVGWKERRERHDPEAAVCPHIASQPLQQRRRGHKSNRPSRIGDSI